MARELEIKYDQKAVTPFWRKLPFFFLFPFRFGPLIFLACIITASALAGLALGSFSLILKGFLVYLGLRYAFNVLELFSKGRFEGESVDHRLWGPEKRPAKLGLVIALFIVLGANIGNLALDGRVAADPRTQERLVERYKQDHAEEVAQLERERAAYQQALARAQAEAAAAAARPSSTDEDGNTFTAAAEPADLPSEPPGGTTRAEMIERAMPAFGDLLWFQLQPMWFWLFMAVLSLMLPAAAIVIALEDSLPRAFNPFNVITLVQAMGSAYFVLWGFFLAIAGSRQLALVVGQGWPPAVRFPLEMAVANYLGLVLFALMGYALYQFHQELHLDVDVDFDEHREAGGAEAIAAAGSARAAAVKQGAVPADPWERKVHDLVTQGNFKDAIGEVRDRMRYDRMDVPLNQRLHALLLRQADDAATLAHGQQFVTALARAGLGRELAEALRKLQALDATFLPADGDAVLPAATAAVQQRDFALATQLLRGFDKRFPGHKDTPGVYFLGARLLSEQNRQHDKAARILRSVLQHFPEHPVAPEARNYLQVLERMMAKAAGTGATA
ncbi:outer membrane protein assembly factor BamD [Caenimonas sedimenti]|uniref:Outer membrane protein assembly factor BamD n=1 Tax=Caenimonas sedimenti TaxID=2596921 RepID=A0A562ZUZ0_9BURK|nr:outer membrane protein assembly factor BamD [Caenimonas sedimenti]TWO72419.1 outer membrane protein assembly factor BamD [Caenimonas sedimenti]